MAVPTAREKREQREREAQAQLASQATNRAHIANPGAAAASGEIARPQHAGDKVIVGCKLGIAYIDLQLSKLFDKQENTQTGPRTIKEAQRIGPIVRIRGTAYPRGTVPDGFPERPMIVAGAALNPGVDRDFWEQWREVNKLNPLVVNGMIFAYGDEASAMAFARETVANLSGLDPINPKDDSRIPKSTRADLSNPETEEGRASKARMTAA